jgi:hypothetical protein
VVEHDVLLGFWTLGVAAVVTTGRVWVGLLLLNSNGLICIEEATSLDSVPLVAFRCTRNLIPRAWRRGLFRLDHHEKQIFSVVRTVGKPDRLECHRPRPRFGRGAVSLLGGVLRGGSTPYSGMKKKIRAVDATDAVEAVGMQEHVDAEQASASIPVKATCTRIGPFRACCIRLVPIDEPLMPGEFGRVEPH